MKKLFYILCFTTTLVCQNLVFAAKNQHQNIMDLLFSKTQEQKIKQTTYDHKQKKKERQKKEKERLTKIKINIPKYKKQIFNPRAPGRITFGNPNGKIIIAEFTQYQCPLCKDAAKAVYNLLKKHPEIQLIVIYWPFFGNDSVYTAKAVLAAAKQNKAKELDQAFFAQKNFITKNQANTIIKKVLKTNSKKLFADINAKELDRGLKANFKLAKKLGLTGTPLFIFTNKETTRFYLIPGYTVDFKKDLKQALKGVG